MFKSLLTLNIAIPASTTAGAPRAPLAAARAHDGGPRSISRGSRIVRLGVVLATCGFVAFAGWILATGVFDLEPGGAATGTAARACEPSNCMAALTPAYRQLPREWRWEGKKIEFEHMYRKK
jgi:hypothetical protein